MIFNNSIIESSLMFDNLDDIEGAISYKDYQANTVDLRSEFNIDIIRLLLQNQRPEFITERRKTKRGRPNEFNKRK